MPRLLMVGKSALNRSIVVRIHARQQFFHNKFINENKRWNHFGVSPRRDVSPKSQETAEISVKVLKIKGVLHEGFTTMIDLGCGRGHWISAFSKILPNLSTIFAVDYSTWQLSGEILDDPRVKTISGLMPESLSQIPPLGPEGIILASFVKTRIFRAGEGLAELIRLTGEGLLIVVGDTPLDEVGLEKAGFKKKEVFNMLDTWRKNN